MSQELLTLAKGALALAKKHGADGAAASVTRTRDVETRWRDGKLEKLSDAVGRSLSMSLYVDERYGAVTTSDLRPEAVDRFVADAVALVRAVAKDKHRRLPDPSLYAGRSDADLELYDPSIAELTPAARLARAKALEDAARAVPGAARILSVTTSVSDSEEESARVASNGFEGAFQATSFTASAEVSVKDDDGRRPEDWDSVTVRRLADLTDATTVGRMATTRALARLGAKKTASGAMNVLVEARAARSLLRHLLPPLAGSALQQKESFFEGKMGAVVASPLLTMTDEPLLRRGLGSRSYDGEGMTTRSRPIIEKGTLRQALLDVYYASKLGLAPTTGRTTNLVVTPGTRSLEALALDMKEGILVTSFLGGNSNSTTGVFSLGVAGFRVAGGKRVEPIAEMNISGKHLEFWRQLVAIGNDPYVYSPMRSPSLLFERVSVAGK